MPALAWEVDISFVNEEAYPESFEAISGEPRLLDLDTGVLGRASPDVDGNRGIPDIGANENLCGGGEDFGDFDEAVEKHGGDDAGCLGEVDECECGEFPSEGGLPK